MKQRATIRTPGGGLTIGQLADEWRTSTEWVREQIDAELLALDESNRVTLAEQGRFLAESVEAWDARPQW